MRQFYLSSRGTIHIASDPYKTECWKTLKTPMSPLGTEFRRNENWPGRWLLGNEGYLGGISLCYACAYKKVDEVREPYPIIVTLVDEESLTV